MHYTEFSYIWTEERDRDNAANMYILDLLESQPSTYTTYKLLLQCNIIENDNNNALMIIMLINLGV